MKLRADLSLFLVLFLLSSSLSYTDNDYFSIFPSINTIETTEEVNVHRNSGGGRSSRDTSSLYLPDKLTVSEEVYNKKFPLGSGGVISALWLLGVDLEGLPREEYWFLRQFYDELRFGNIKINGTDMIDIREYNSYIQYMAEYMGVALYKDDNNLGYLVPYDSYPLHLAPNDTKATVTGIVYHPDYSHLSTNFVLNFHKPVTEAVYGN
ncbi:hypothetical protein SAMN05446037_100255 [Anaerovirgula multivorans]|uniref:Uncharacterized protein n=1 Tax=Anaerovirgula multivorans TaxID=312168 RepID=A0A239AI43_9FIRM|nr:hypothetical protein [Anaerovirgula multivorans]SNR95305.1 hypothetical protein SAMN05446037_100255 [Anaerovirgula multivorans]